MRACVSILQSIRGLAKSNDLSSDRRTDRYRKNQRPVQTQTCNKCLALDTRWSLLWGFFFIATVLLNILRTIVRNIATSLQNRSCRKFQKRLDFVWVFLKFPKHKSTLIKPNIIFLYFTLSSYLCVCVFLSYHYLAPPALLPPAHFQIESWNRNQSRACVTGGTHIKAALSFWTHSPGLTMPPCTANGWQAGPPPASAPVKTNNPGGYQMQVVYHGTSYAIMKR